MPAKLQAIVKNDQLVSLDRDVAHNFRFVALEVFRSLNEGRWGDLAQLIKASEVTDLQLSKAYEALVVFVTSAAEPVPATMEACMTEAGFFDIRPAAQLALMATLGQVMMGIYWQGARDASAMGKNKGPC